MLARNPTWGWHRNWGGVVDDCLLEIVDDDDVVDVGVECGCCLDNDVNDS